MTRQSLPVRSIILSILLSLFSSFTIHAQTAAGSTSVSVRLDAAYNGGGENKPSWKIDNRCSYQNGYGWLQFNQIVTWVSGQANQSFSLPLEAWREDNDCDDRCRYEGSCGFGGNDSDNGRAWGTASFSLLANPPGVFFTLPDVMFGTFGVRLSVSYSTPVPDQPSIIVNEAPYTGANVCSNQLMKFRPSTLVDASFNYMMDYTWEYHIKGDSVQEERMFAQCYFDPFLLQEFCWEEPYWVTVPQWRTVTVTNGGVNAGELTVRPNELSGLENLFGSQQIFFRVRASANGSVSNYSAASSAINLNPSAPIAGNVSTRSSCSLSPSGAVVIQNVTSNFSTPRYVLKSGANATLGCNPDTGGCLLPTDYSGIISNVSYFEIPNVSPGDYTLFLLNNAGVEGFCPSSGTNRTVSVIPNPTISSFAPNPVTCHGAANGSLSYTISNGKSDYIAHSLTNLTTGQSWGQATTSSGSSVPFTSLSPGSYRLTANDFCGTIITQEFQLTEPVQVTGTDFQVAASTCLAPGNGTMKVDVVKSTGTSISPLFHYQLYNNGALVSEITKGENTNTWNNLAVGNAYTVLVKEPGTADCNAHTRNFVIDGPAPLSIQDIQVANATCYGFSDGSLSFSGSGGINTYYFEITSDGNTLQNNTGSFPGIAAGDFELVLRSAVTGCTDYVSNPSTVTVGQPTEISVPVSKQDISCFSRTDGTIQTSASGGTPGTTIPYTYTWEMRTSAGDWATLGSTTSSLTDLSAGEYRAIVRDGRNCQQVSSEIIILEPALLQLESIDLHDIDCKGESGSIAIAALGGILPYTYEYTKDEGSDPIAFDSSTPLTAGDYRVRVKDHNGCLDSSGDMFTITEPPEPLDFEYSLSDYNGVSISCFGGNNGWIAITPHGGNGAAYAGYTYALNDSDFTLPQTIENLEAGNYTVYVKDGRDCISQKELTLTQSEKQIGVLEVTVQDVACLGDRTGILTVQASGGIAPYEYQLSGNAVQSSNIFDGLPVGAYSIIVNDKNGCDVTTGASITSIHPPFYITESIGAVKCFAGNDGEIALSIAGGTSPFQYQWEGSSETASVRGNLRTGDYKVKVTDGANCSQEAILTVTQPQDPLYFHTEALPVCFGSSSGELTVVASGGTSPYVYSVGGLDYQNENIFPSVLIGSHTVNVRDFNGCTEQRTTTIVQREDRPEPNFIIATKRYASDTLIAKEICIPKPDSVQWTFHQSLTIISDDEWSPQISFRDEGSYPVSMTAFFSGCDYTITKFLQVNPADAEIIVTDDFPTIQVFEVSPNPSPGGVFDVNIVLRHKQNLVLTIYDILGNIHYKSSWEKVKSAQEHISLPVPASGLYLLRVITETDAKEARLIINR